LDPSSNTDVWGKVGLLKCTLLPRVKAELCDRTPCAKRVRRTRKNEFNFFSTKNCRGGVFPPRSIEIGLPMAGGQRLYAILYIGQICEKAQDFD